MSGTRPRGLGSQQSPCNFQVLSHSGSPSFVINSGSGVQSNSIPRASQNLAGLVVATPLTSSVPRAPQQIPPLPPRAPQQIPPLPISKVLIKVCPKGKKKETKTFSLRNIHPSKVVSVENLKTIIRTQLQGEISQSSKFDIGYLQGSNVVSIRSEEDLLEIWENFRKGANITLWCDCLQKSGHKRARNEDESSEDEVEVGKAVKKRKRDEEKDDKVEATIKQLKINNGDNSYTPMQYRVWAEMVIGGVHTSIDCAPTTTMFIRAGGGVKKKTDHSAIVGSVGSSPAKVIDSRSKCYKQLSDLKNLLESRVLSEQEYNGEKATIMGMLKKLV